MNFFSKNSIKIFSFLSLFFIVSCNDDDTATPEIEVPATYSFSRDGQSTVDFSGQTTRILMAEELTSSMINFGLTEATLLEMYSNETADGGDANPFSTVALNESTKSIRSKVAASTDFFAANTTQAIEIRNTLGNYISAQTTQVFPNQNVAAEPGIAGQVADGTSTRYVNDFGIEYNQIVAKSLIGALMADQILNNYLAPAVLDEADNIANNDAAIVEDGKPYTTMEHKWDEAYGYVYGTSMETANPNATIGEDDNFLNEYIGKVNEDPDFVGIADDIFDAFKLGRAAIVAGDYKLRDEQAAIIREKISEVIAIRGIFYLQIGKTKLEANPTNPSSAFHALSEALGFIYSLQFTRKANEVAPYFTKTEVEAFATDIYDDGTNGLWNVTPATLESISQAIAARFNFTVEQAK